MIDAINECSKSCTDPIVKEKLIKAKNQIELIQKNAPEAICDKLTPEEAVIVLLLSFIREKEMNHNSDTFDIDILSDADEWLTKFKGTILR